MKRFFSAGLCTLAAVGLAACGESDGFVAPNYETFDSSSQTTSNIASVAVREGPNNALTIEEGSGTLTHNTGALEVDDGAYQFSDSNGVNFIGNYTDANGASISTQNQNLDTSGYEYVTGFTQQYVVNGEQFQAQGLIGVVTRPGDMPNDGSATYTGTGFARITQNNTTTILSDGTSTIAADFANGTATATINQFTTSTDPAGNAVAAPIAQVSATDMAIVDNTFSGTQVFALDANNLPVSIAGAGATAQAQGAFYGYDAGARGPDEVGGSVLVTGPGGTIIGGFVGD